MQYETRTRPPDSRRLRGPEESRRVGCITTACRLFLPGSPSPPPRSRLIISRRIPPKSAAYVRVCARDDDRAESNSSPPPNLTSRHAENPKPFTLWQIGYNNTYSRVRTRTHARATNAPDPNVCNIRAACARESVATRINLHLPRRRVRGKNPKFVSYANQSPRRFIKTNTTTRPTRETKRVDRKIQFVDLLPRARTSSESNDNNNALKRYARSKKFPQKKKTYRVFTYVSWGVGGTSVRASVPRTVYAALCTVVLDTLLLLLSPHRLVFGVE